MAKRGCFGRVILWLIILGLVCCGILFGTGYFQYRSAIAELPIATAVANVEAEVDYTPYAEISPYYLKDVVIVEDKRFYEHGAIDPIGLVRAIVIDIKEWNFSEGGSTITQQVAKNLYFSNEKRMTRKIAEMFVAIDLEEKYTKDEILGIYSNIIYFGQNCYGIGDASNVYFKKQPLDLTFEEAAMLAGIPQAPSRYNPIDSPEKAKERTEAVLEILEDNGVTE